tara:strand:+ start:966 stop:2390 length:1425 start_codon:yes stop_codon:yes gene_type:complete
MNTLRSRGDLRPAQLALIDEIKSFPSGIAVLGMGGGKTAAYMTALRDMIADGLVEVGIMLAPARVVDNVWPKEPAKWSHLQGMRVVAVTGTPARRAGLMMSDADMFVVSIDNVKWLVDYLVANKWHLSRIALGIDEMSKFKSPTSKRGRELMKISHKFNGVWGLTGTPRPNGVEDLFLPIKIVGGKMAWGVSSFTDWRKQNFFPLDFQGYKWQAHAFCVPRLERIAQEWMVYGPVDDLVKPRLNTGADFVRYVDLTDEQVAHTSDLVAQMMTTVGRGRAEQIIEAMSQGAVSGKLAQIVQGFAYGEGGEAIPLRGNPKLDALKEIDEELGGDTAIITYGFRAEIPQLREALKHRRVGLLGGGVGTSEANATIDAWNAGEIDRLLLHPASAGHGVELQFGGHHMIHYHPTWSSELYDQVVKRMDRPGQTREMYNWWISARSSIDDLKFARVEEKMQSEEAFRQILRRMGMATGEL